MRSKIEWTQITWNPITGCSKISPGCQNCYAEKFANRLKAIGLYKYRNGFLLTLHPEELKKPYLLKKPSIIFVNSMSDLFHKNIPISFIKEVFKVMNDNQIHIFQILTKRAEILLEYDLKGYLKWTPNIWMGVSVENQDYAYRIEFLKQTGANVKFVSFEPLLGPVDTDLKGIDWVIVGGESGLNARQLRIEWVRKIRDICIKDNIPFFFKQWGGKNRTKNGRILDGKLWNEMPKEIANLPQKSF